MIDIWNYSHHSLVLRIALCTSRSNKYIIAERLMVYMLPIFFNRPFLIIFLGSGFAHYAMLSSARKPR